MHQPDGDLVQLHRWPHPAGVAAQAADAPRDGRDLAEAARRAARGSPIPRAFGGTELGYLALAGASRRARRWRRRRSRRPWACLQARRTLQRTLLQTVTALAALVESKDEYTEDRGTRIAERVLQVGIGWTRRSKASTS